MKQKIFYCCEFCDEYFPDQADCESHEAKHFGLTRREYLDWRVLNKDAASAGKSCGVSNNPATRAEFDRTIRVLCSFEKKHGLTDSLNKPSDFYT